MKKMKTKASPGKDGISGGLLKLAIKHRPADDYTLVDLVLCIAQAIYDSKGAHDVTKHILCRPLWKKRGNKQLDNIRPIALQNALAKIPSSILADRLADDLLANGALHKANEGFLRNRETADAVETVLNLWEDAMAQNEPSFYVAYDVSKAYDRLRWFTMKNGMERIGIPEKFQRYVLGKMEGSQMYVKTGYGLTEPFEVKRGCPQGDPLSPLLYIISMDALHAGLECNPLPEHKGAKDGRVMAGTKEEVADKCYADDTLLLPSSLGGLVRMNEWVKAFCAHNYISMSQEKTKTAGVDKDGNDVQFSIEIVQYNDKGEPTVCVVDSQPSSAPLKYLGFMINLHLNWQPHINKMKQIVGMYCNLINSNKPSPEAAIYILNHILKPKLTYRMKLCPIDEKTLEDGITTCK
jgi:hypothetical protein